ncbi:outer membrane lipoprotein SlyB [Flavobacterium sp. 28YEA47A]|uniref:bacteriocin class II family protein n=1 Tax=Flavobacterium sp. 28YEA47A TaxID=3156276 RepID=UPI003512E479
MRKIFLSAITMIFLTMFLFVTSCSEENENSEMNSKNELNDNSSSHLRKPSIEFNTLKNSHLAEKLSRDFVNLEITILKIQKPAIEFIRSKGIDVSNTDSLIAFYENCEECDDKYRDALTPLLKDLSQASDNKVLDILAEYSNNIDRLDLDEVNRNNLKFMINSMMIGVNNSLLINDGYENLPTIIRDNQYITFGFWDCLRQTGGKAIGRGLVTGMITGCIGGAIAGATIGTVTVPVLGTATGAVGGCIFGGAAGAVTGAVTGAIWAAVDCI